MPRRRKNITELDGSWSVVYPLCVLTSCNGSYQTLDEVSNGLSITHYTNMVILTFNMSKPSKSTIVDNQNDSF